MIFMYNLMSSNISVSSWPYTITDCEKPFGTREINGTSDVSQFSDARIAVVFCLHIDVTPSRSRTGTRQREIKGCTHWVYLYRTCLHEYTLVCT